MRTFKTTIIYNWYDQVWNNANKKAIDEMLDPNTIAHGISDGAPLTGVDEFKKFYHAFRQQFSKVTVNIQDVICQDDIQCARCDVEAVDRATSKTVHFSGLCMAVIRDGKIIEAWNHFDFLKMNLQLGLKLVAA